MQKGFISLLGCCKKMVIVVILFMPIWCTPIRTAALDTHVAVVGLAWVLAVAIVYGGFANVLPTWQQRILVEFIGIFAGIVPVGALSWNIVSMGTEGKLVGLYFLAAVLWCFVLTHRKPNGLEIAFER